MKGFDFDNPFGDLFDLNGDGITDGGELMASLQMLAPSSEEAIRLTGSDDFYIGGDITEDEDDLDLCRAVMDKEDFELYKACFYDGDLDISDDPDDDDLFSSESGLDDFDF